MTVLIAGGGIGGLTLALSLHQVGIPCRVFESVPELAPLGVGINLQPHAVRELDELGLLADLDAIGLRTQEVAYVSSHGKTIWSEPRGLMAGYQWPQISLHRGKLQMMLFSAVQERLGPGAITCGRALRRWSSTNDGICATFTSGDNATDNISGDLLIAADGIHSSARALMYPHEGPPVWGGTVMWRGVSKGPRFMTSRTMAMAGCKARKFVCYPIAEDGDQLIINWIADLKFPSDYLWNREDWNRQGKLEDFLPEFADWHFDWLDVPHVMRSAPSIFEYPMVDREPVGRWTDGRMTLIGDAAHAMYPIGSNGASQAILDARVLTQALLGHGLNEDALLAYEEERRPVTSKIVLANRGDGPDKILDVVEERAPDGFADIEDVLSRDELERTANAYKSIAGMDVETLNARPSIVQTL
jgi:5-methylphenazine-1-carboxylate 1-monooxygenase